MTRPLNNRLDQAAQIYAFQGVVSNVRDHPISQPKGVSVLRYVRRLIPVLIYFGKLLMQLRFAFGSLPVHDWVVAYDSSRVQPLEGESPYSFIYRIGRTNRADRLPALFKIKESDRIILIDVAKTFGRQNVSYGTLSYLLSISNLADLPRLILDTVTGWRALGSLRAAVMYAGLCQINRLHHKTQRGLVMFTSVTWMAEVLRVGMACARVNLEIIEILHGAGSARTAPYFEWVHSQAIARIVYVNLIADLPRYSPLDSHMLKDDQGEISCNVRLWQGLGETKCLSPTETSCEQHIVFIGGASSDDDYAQSSYFTKECRMISAIRARNNIPIIYCPHPHYNAAKQAELLEKLSPHHMSLSNGSTLEAILGASIVVGGFSTSLVEAALLEIPSFSYENMEFLFIQRTANLVKWNEDVESLAESVEKAIEASKEQSHLDRLAKTAHWAKQRYGLEMDITTFTTVNT